MATQPLTVAFKEWAAICQALGEGRQCLILRKGGIAEERGLFRAEHDEFLLYPTYFHEQRSGLKPDYQHLLDSAEQSHPAQGTIAFRHFARVTDIHFLTNLEKLLALDTLHAWTSGIVRQRFAYRTPGLYVLMVRAFRLPQCETRHDCPDYAGCKTWVALDSPLATDGAVPVVSDEDFAASRLELNRIVQS
jgi:hypothetical protein